MVHIQSSSAKKSIKGEDFFVVEENLALTLAPPCGSITFNIYAVFDGHGSQAVANYCQSNFIPTLMASFSEAKSARDESPAKLLQKWEHLAHAAMRQTFKSIDEYACSRFERSGSTATVCCIAFGAALEAELGSRAHVLVANVGDSNAILDAGESIFTLNEDHRLAINRAEQQRIRIAGGVVDKESEKDCLRLWPGGLMMSRSLGDRDAVHAIAEPAIRSSILSLSPAFGSRLVIASDGLWDAVPPKMATSAVRKKKTHVASQALVQMAAKRAGKDKDDITVIVVDLVYEEGHRPFETLTGGSGSVIQRKQRSMSLSELRPVFWKPGRDLVPEIAPLRYDVQEAPEEGLVSREEEEEVEDREEKGRVEASGSFVEDDVGLERALALSIAEEDEGEWQSVAPRRRRSSKLKQQQSNPVEEEDGESKEEENDNDSDKAGKKKQKQKQKQKQKKRRKQGKKSKPMPKLAESVSTCKDSSEGEVGAKVQVQGEPEPAKDKGNRKGETLTKQQRRKKKQVCFQFLKGKCTKGEACQYAHKERENRRAKQDTQPIARAKDGKFDQTEAETKANAEAEGKAKAVEEKPQRRRRMDVYISGLVEGSHSKQDIRKYIEQFGKIASMNYRKRRNGQQYGFCLVGFQDASDIDKILAVERHVLNEVEINVAKYQPKQKAG